MLLLYIFSEFLNTNIGFAVKLLGSAAPVRRLLASCVYKKNIVYLLFLYSCMRIHNLVNAFKERIGKTLLFSSDTVIFKDSLSAYMFSGDGFRLLSSL